MGSLSGQTEEGLGDLALLTFSQPPVVLGSRSGHCPAAFFQLSLQPIQKYGITACVSRRFSLAESILFDVFKFYPVCCGLGLHAKGS